VAWTVGRLMEDTTETTMSRTTNDILNSHVLPTLTYWAGAGQAHGIRKGRQGSVFHSRGEKSQPRKIYSLYDISPLNPSGMFPYFAHVVFL